MASSIFKIIQTVPDKRTSLALYNIFKKFTSPTTDPTAWVDMSAVTSTAAELNIMDGALVTAAELNRAADVSTRIVSTTAATLAVTLADHESKTVVLASTHTQTLTLPAATGSGARFRFAVSVVGTDGSKVIKVANTADLLTGVCIVNSTSTAEASSFLTTATDDTITLNNTTTGGIKGTTVEIEDIATATFLVRVEAASSGAVATCFSASV